MQNVNFVPLIRATAHVQAVAGGANILAAAIGPSSGHLIVTMRVQILCSGAGVYSVGIIRGGVTVTGTVLNGAAIAANDWQQFDVDLRDGDTMNVSHSVGGNITMRISEIYGATG